MVHAPEAVTGKTLAGFAALAVVLSLFAALIALWVGPSGQPVVVRIAAALFCAVVTHRLIRIVHAAALIGQQTPADIALRPHVAAVEVDPLLAQLVKETRTGIGMRIVTPGLWQRVQELCRRHGVGTAGQPVQFHSWQEVEHIVEHLEDAT
jgi:hypothetical protein